MGHEREIVKLSEQYAASMKAGIHSTCLRIERAQGLDGLPPELVSVGLLALEAGRDPYAAIYGHATEAPKESPAAPQQEVK